MATPVLVTKLFIPAPRPQLVARNHLIDRLNDRLDRGMTLISAPAGFGKTTLLSAWVASLEEPTAWVSLDEADSDPTRFLTYLIAAMQTVQPGVGAAWSETLASSAPPAPESVLVGLLNEISQRPDRLVVVLDDYHAIDSAAVDQALTFLLEHLPPQLHVVVATRQDPDVPLARLRARGQVTELRAADLRFTPAEAAEFLNSVMGLGLSPDDIVSLESRTEGWAAGLQLAALSMRGQADVSGFINAFAGDHRYIADYLVGEVLGRQPADVRRFLLQSAVLDRMNGSLCDAVTGQADSDMQLEALERGNFFVVPLDDKRHWYRYHHLFAEVLRAFLHDELADEVPELHRRASAWYEQDGSLTEAISHSLTAADFERAAHLVERAAFGMLQLRRETAVLGWLRALPEDVFERRPVLSAVYAATLLLSGEIGGVDARLAAAERWLEPVSTGKARTSPSPADMVVADPKAWLALPGSLAVWRAGLSLAQGEIAETVRHATRALDVAADEDFLARGAAAALLGLAAWRGGDLDAAYERYAEAITQLDRAGSISDVIGCSIASADIRTEQGQLPDAMGVYESGLQRAMAAGPALRGAADMHVGIAELHREHGDLVLAGEHIARAQELGENAGLPQYPYRWRAALARLAVSDGDLSGAEQLLHEAERVFTSDFSPVVRPVSAMRARVWIAQGRLPDAFSWARQHGLSVDDELTYLREYEHITLARLLLAQGQRDQTQRTTLVDATRLLDGLLREAEQGSRTGNLIEVLLLQALALQASEGVAASLAPIERALTIAEPHGYFRVFVDAGPPMTALLQAVAKRASVRAYARHLLAAFGDSDRQPSTRQALIDPLSARELEVLRLLRTDMDGPDIARQLVVSLNTMRTHTKNIYSKLGVTNRRAAVRRAEELDLLSRS